MNIQKVCVYCASSRQINSIYLKAASCLGRFLVQNKITIVYGGGAYGAMGALANAALKEGGNVIGIMPRFLIDLELAHPHLTTLKIVETMHERKTMMVHDIDAIIALPGGSGTLEELIEAITWKRLGMMVKPIVIVNLNQFYDPLIQLFENIVREKFMDERHLAMWNIVDAPEDVLKAISHAMPWSIEARKFAAV